MRLTRTKQAICRLAAICAFATPLYALHTRTPRPPAPIHFTPEHHPKSAKTSTKPTKTYSKAHLAAQQKLHAKRLIYHSEKVSFRIRNSAKAHLASKFHPSLSAMPATVVSIIRQNGIHPRLEPTDEAVTTPQILPNLYDSTGRLTVLPALRGTHDILLHQNQMADQDGLTRIQDDEDLQYMLQKKELVALPENQGLHVDQRLPLNRRLCRPWVAAFLSSIARSHYDQFHTPLQVNSAVRTVSFQRKLIRTNANAAQAEGEAASPHLTGQAIDIAKKGLSNAEIAWMRIYLKVLVEENDIDVEEEFQQACFHLSVYKKYSQPSLPAQRIASTHRVLTPALAATLQ